MNRVAAAHAAHDGGIEPCGFDEDVLRLGRDHGVPAAHDAGEAEGFFLVGYNYIIGIEHAVYAVEGFELFAGARAADEDGAFDLVEVEGVGGVAHAEQDVVAGVDGIEDELLAEGGEALGDDVRWMGRS